MCHQDADFLKRSNAPFFGAVPNRYGMKWLMGTPGRPHGTPVDVGLGASFRPILPTQAQTVNELTTSQLVQDSEKVPIGANRNADSFKSPVIGQSLPPPAATTAL